MDKGHDWLAPTPDEQFQQRKQEEQAKVNSLADIDAVARRKDFQKFAAEKGLDAESIRNAIRKVAEPGTPAYSVAFDRLLDEWERNTPEGQAYIRSKDGGKVVPPKDEPLQ